MRSLPGGSLSRDVKDESIDVGERGPRAIVDTTGALDILGRTLRGAVGEIAPVGIVGDGIAEDGTAG